MLDRFQERLGVGWFIYRLLGRIVILGSNRPQASI
jgi:hypothetical protein